MSEIKRLPNWLNLYPAMGYNPEGGSSCFFFGPLCYGANIEEEDMEEKLRIFPRKGEIEILFTQEQKKLAEKFTGIDDQVFCSESEKGLDERTLVINHLSAPFAPALGFIMEFPIIRYSLHNCTTPNLAVIMYPLGLIAIRKIYDIYRLDTTPLPSISFDKYGLNFSFPFPILEGDKKQYTPSDLERILSPMGLKFDISGNQSPYRVRIGETQLEIIAKNGERTGRINGKVPTTIEQDLRNRIAICLISAASSQASTLYQNQHYCENDP